MKHLERDRALVLEILGKEDGSHAAMPKFALQFVTGQRRLDGATKIVQRRKAIFWKPSTE